MSDRLHRDKGTDEVEQQAANWISRLDFGLSPEEQDALFDWIAADPRNAEALARHRRNWRRLDKLADWRPEHGKRPDPDLLAPPRRTRWKRRDFLAPLAAAAALVIASGLWNRFSSTPPKSEPGEVALQPENRQILADGSTVKQKSGTTMTVLYSSTERRIRLDRGEGFFLVTKDPARPFVIEVHGIEVCAVGTAFNVKLETAAVSVLVAEGVVRVDRLPQVDAATGKAAPPATTVLQASQLASIPLTPQPPPPAITTLTKREVQRALAWQHGLMAFDKCPLARIVAELNLLNEKQLIVGDDGVGSMQFSGTIQSNNVEGFVRLLEAGFGVRGEAAGPKEFVLRRM